MDLSKLSYKELDTLLEQVVVARNAAWQALGSAPIEHPVNGWNCFHCGMKFHHVHQARLHFGTAVDATPYCQFSPEAHNLIHRIRELELELETTREVFAEHLEGCSDVSQSKV